MSKAVFLGTPCYGHIEVTLGLVHELVERGEQLLYYNNSSFQSLIEKTGCIFRDYRVDYGRLGSFQSGEPVLERLSGLDHLVGIIDLSIEENEAMYENIVQEIRDEKPDYILYDTFRYIGKRIAQELSIPAISTIPIFVYSKEFSCYYPQIYLSKILRLDREELGCNKDPKKILHLLYRHIENHIYQKFGLPDFDLYDTINCLSDYNIVFTSSSLLRDQEIYDERFMFAGCCLEYRERTEVQPTDARTCIVISLGTTYVNQQKAFYQKCLEAFGSLDMEIYMNIGRNIQPGELGYIPPRLYSEQYAPSIILIVKSEFIHYARGRQQCQRSALLRGSYVDISD